ncbi:MAG: N-acetyl-gamma-glutamyl-phosphate reductase [Rhodothermales bacterium]
MKKKIALLHGAGYVGGELIRLLLAHPDVAVTTVTSRSFAGDPVTAAHPHLRGQTSLSFTDPGNVELSGVDAVLLAAEHGKGAQVVVELLDSGFDGPIVDLSADFRFKDAALYDEWFGFTHPAPELIASFEYGLPEVHAPYPDGTRYVANPGCFATALALALWPVSRHLDTFRASVTALTGASGSGARPKPTTHFPTREGNVRAYKILRHQHLPEVRQVLGPGADVQFIPASGPWTRGIWGTAHVELPPDVRPSDVDTWFHAAYDDKPFVRTYPNELPELRYAVHSPFCDVGWMVSGRTLVIGFAEDNLLKGAASQAIQNLNLLMHLPETSGLISTDLAVTSAYS